MRLVVHLHPARTRPILRPLLSSLPHQFPASGKSDATISAASAWPRSSFPAQRTRAARLASRSIRSRSAAPVFSRATLGFKRRSTDRRSLFGDELGRPRSRDIIRRNGNRRHSRSTQNRIQQRPILRPQPRHFPLHRPGVLRRHQPAPHFSQLHSRSLTFAVSARMKQDVLASFPLVVLCALVSREWSDPPTSHAQPIVVPAVAAPGRCAAPHSAISIRTAPRPPRHHHPFFPRLQSARNHAPK